MLAAEIDHFLVDAGITPVGNHGSGVVHLAIGSPHFAGGANCSRHGRIDNDIARYVQIGNALVRIHHGEGGTRGVYSLNIGLDRGPLLCGKIPDFRIYIANAIVRINTNLIEQVRVFIEHILVINGNRVAEHDGIRHLHHCCFQMQRQQNIAGIGLVHFGGVKCTQRLTVHDGRINNLALQHRYVFPEHSDLTVGSRPLYAQVSGFTDKCGLLAGIKVTIGHVCNVCPGIG